MSKFLKLPSEFSNSNWSCVASNNNTGSPIWVALADSGPFRVARSTDGVNWTIVQGLSTTVVNKTWTSVAFGSGRFVAVASSGTDRMMTSTDGITWTTVAAGGGGGGYTDRTFTGIAWNGTVFAVVASGVSTGAVQHSTNGTSGYTATDAASSQAWNSIAWNGSAWVIIASDGTGTAQINRMGTATPAGTWTAATTAATTNTWQSVVGLNSTTFVAVANAGANRAYVSTDSGATWTANAGISATVAWKALASNGTNIVAVGQDGTQSTRIATTTNGTAWTAAAGATNNSNIWSGVASLSTSNAYVAVSRSGGQNRILFTSDTFSTSTPVNDSYTRTRTDAPTYLDVEKVITAQEGSSTTVILNVLTPNASSDVVTLTFGEDLTGATHEAILDAIVDANSPVTSPEGAFSFSLPENRTITATFA